MGPRLASSSLISRDQIALDHGERALLAILKPDVEHYGPERACQSAVVATHIGADQVFVLASALRIVQREHRDDERENRQGSASERVSWAPKVTR